MSDDVAAARVALQEKSALDEFLPEHVIRRQAPDVHQQLRLDPRDVELEPIERLGSTPSGRSARQAQLWPMLAAALVALGVSVITLAVVASYGLF